MEKMYSQMATLYQSDHLSAMLAYWDEHLICRFANNAYIEWFGRSMDELVDKVTLPEVLGNSFDKIKPYVEGVLAGKVQQFEREIELPNGTAIYTITNYYPDVLEGRVRGFYVHIADISKIKKLEIDLSSSERKFKNLLETAPDAIVIVNPAGEIQIVNAQTEKLFGFSRTELLGRHADMLLPERLRMNKNEEQAGWFTNPFLASTDKAPELFGLHKNGSEFPVEITTNPITLDDGPYVSAAIRDITSRKRQEIFINHMAVIIESSSDAIISRTIEGEILSWNKGAEKLLGYTFEEIRGQNISLLFPAEMLAEEKEQVAKVLQGETVEQYDTVMDKKNGTRINISITLSPIRNSSGKIVSISKIIRDITKETRAKAQLNESNERNKIFVQQAPNAIAMFDKNMCYLAASKRWIDDYNLQGKEILGKSHYHIFPEIGDDWKAIHKACLKGEINQCDEAFFERADGSTQWITWDVRPWYISEGDIGGLIMYTADISILKEKEREKRNIEEILDKTNDVARIGTWEVDLVANLVKWSRITKEIHEVEPGYVPDLQGGINFYREGESQEKVMRALNEMINDNKNLDLELEIITAKKNLKWVRAIGQAEFKKGICKRLYGVFQDITETKNAREAVNRLNEELNTILNAGYVSIIGTDKDGLITHFNKGAEILLQYKAGEIIGIHTPALLHVEAEVVERGKQLSEQYGRTIEGFGVFVELLRQGEFESREWTYVRKDGSTFPVQLVVTAVRNMQGEIIGFLGVATDISELKKAEKEMKSLLDITTDQNERLKNFAHIVSHNLRSHSGNIDMILDLYIQDNPAVAVNEYISLLKKSSGNLKETIANLNEVVLMNTSFEEKLVPINLHQLIEAATQNVSQMAREGLVTIYNEVNADVEVLGLAAYLDSILLNFISNGIKYRATDREPFIRLSAIKQEAYVLLKIEDNGLGINIKKYGAKLFGMYKTFHGNADARGIGLFITKNQIEAMGGKVEVESEVNKGTLFKIYFKYEKN